MVSIRRKTLKTEAPPAEGLVLRGPFSLEEATSREWIVTNGLGGYASASLCGMSTRRYHGLLVAALRPPGMRTLLVAKLEETIHHAGEAYPLSTNQYPGVIHPQGYQYLQEFALTAEGVTLRFAADGMEVEKRIQAVQGENTTRVSYKNCGETPIVLTLAALVNGRDFHGETPEGSLQFQVDDGRWSGGPQVAVRPTWMGEPFWLYADAGSWHSEQTWYHNMLYSWERYRGLTEYDNHFSPGSFLVELDAGRTVTVILSTLPPPVGEACPVEREEVWHPIPGDAPVEIQALYRAAHSFLVERREVQHERREFGRTIIAGYHWFGDWGRDTMIALPGICLTTGRYRDAAEILRTFAAARQRGLLPNLFAESGEGAAYNAADATLWFVYAVERYYQVTKDRVLLDELRPALEEIIHYYRTGTDYGIGMDEDGLIVATAPGWQLTWMDAKVGDWVVTPRMGKPVELSALWYNALRTMEAFSREFGWSDDYGKLAERVRKSFPAFWNEEGGYLYDVLAETPDARLRPNQIFAVSLPYSPLDLGPARKVVKTVERYLLTPYGLRSLAPQDPEYQGTYGGNSWERDGAYHQGTVWSWLIGPYIDAFLRVHGDTADAKSVCRKLLQPLLAHVWEAGMGSISEIFEGNAPHLPRGTISQAWSVAEVLRVWEKVK
ncbi:MAG TPA: amylo-alpha-1,6-glucosidase [Armatimonadota bacterium]